MQLPGIYFWHHCWQLCPASNWHCTPDFAPITVAHCEEVPHDQWAQSPLPVPPPLSPVQITTEVHAADEGGLEG